MLTSMLKSNFCTKHNLFLPHSHKYVSSRLAMLEGRESSPHPLHNQPAPTQQWPLPTIPGESTRSVPVCQLVLVSCRVNTWLELKMEVLCFALFLLSQAQQSGSHPVTRAGTKIRNPNTSIDDTHDQVTVNDIFISVKTSGKFHKSRLFWRWIYSETKYNKYMQKKETKYKKIHAEKEKEIQENTCSKGNTRKYRKRNTYRNKKYLNIHTEIY